MPRYAFVPARVIIEICRPVPWPTDASKFDDSTRISWIMSELGDARDAAAAAVVGRAVDRVVVAADAADRAAGRLRRAVDEALRHQALVGRTGSRPARSASA